MRICFVCPPAEFYSPVSGGAIATIAMQTGKQLHRRGHHVSVVTPGTTDALYDVGELLQVRVPGRADLSFLKRRLAGLARRWNRWDWPYYGYYIRAVRRALVALIPAPDAIVVFNDLTISRYLRRSLPHARITVWLQNEQRTNQSPVQLRAAVDATDVFLTCSQYIKDWTCQTHPISPEQVVVAHSGVDLEAFRPSENFPRRGQTLRALFVGRIDPNKGPDLAVDAVAALRSEGVSVELTVVGGLWFYGGGDPMADPFFRDLKLKMDVAGADYLGHVSRDNIPAVIRGHDVAFVLSRSNEPFGLVALESMASGCAVIASNRGGLPEACGGASLLVDPDDFNSVVGMLRTLAADNDMLVAQKIAAVARASAAPWSTCADVVERVLATPADQVQDLIVEKKGS